MRLAFKTEETQVTDRVIEEAATFLVIGIAMNLTSQLPSSTKSSRNDGNL